MAVSAEAIIAMVTLLIMCVPGGLWLLHRLHWFRRWKRLDNNADMLPLVEQGKVMSSMDSPLEASDTADKPG